MSTSPKCFLALFVAITLLQPTANAYGQDAVTSKLSSADMTALALWVKILFTSGIVVAWLTLCGILWLSTKHPDNPIFLQVVSKGLIVTGRLHGDLRAENNFFHVGVIPAGGQAFVFDPALGRLLLLQ